MSKIFLSFLGTNRYLSARYRLGERVSGITPFVQEALVELLCGEWGKNDRLIFFLTSEARLKNWEDGGNFSEGLGTRLHRRNLQIEILTVPVSEGRSEEEIRNNFRTVIEKLSEGDEVILDITHSFRSLPMLNLVALNYARVLKGVRIRGIYYGAFEALGSQQEVKNLPEDQRVAPVFDLTSYALLLEWSFAVEEFLRYGLAERLYELVRHEITPILKETRGQDERARNLRNLIEELRNLTLSIYTSRCPQIENFFPRSTVNLRREFLYPFDGLMEKIEEKCLLFSTDDPWEKALAAVEWCIEHRLVQQGYTILLESVITEGCRLLKVADPYKNKSWRDFFSSLLVVTAKKTPPERWTGVLKEEKGVALQIQSKGGEAFLKLARAYKQLNEMRNDINHCGCRDNVHQSQTFIEQLRSSYEAIKESMRSLRDLDFSLHIEANASGNSP